MILTTLAAGLCLLAQAPAPASAATAPSVVQGRGRPAVSIPRIEAAITVDGRLDEPVWSQAVRLAGFSQYKPVDGRPAEERTEVLVWYSPTALHFGILAFDSNPQSVRATVADRDNLSRDDTVTIYLDTFNDRRRAYFFTLNPLGVQEDGVQSEGAFNPGTLYGGNIDRNPDYQFDSKGRLTPEGYTVEVRVPFKSLRFAGNGPQRWGINILRKVQRTGYEDTWTDVRRASSSFLVQAGTLEGLHDLERGLVAEVQPFVTAALDGARDPRSGRFARGSADWGPGVNARLASANAAVDMTVNPDFSQVESDAGQVTANQRFALFYAEKRPFFLDGIELFATPNQLVYTRQIVDPIAGGKFTGKFGRYGVAYLAARDEANEGATVNMTRVRRDIGGNSIAGLTFTDRTSSAGFNRVLAADTRLLFRKLYYVQVQAGRSWTETGGLTRQAPIWTAEYDRTGRAWGFNYKLNGVGAHFVSRSGYVPRSDVVEGQAMNRFSFYGKRGGPVEQVTVFLGPARIWRYGGFGTDAPIEGSETANLMAQLKGGWSISGRLKREFARFDPAMYASYQVVCPTGCLRAYEAPAKMAGAFSTNLTVTTPIYQAVNARAELFRGEVAIFPEAARGRETKAVVGLNVRPTDSIRLEATTTLSRILRQRDDSEFARTIIPRLKVEYQPTRALFVRLVAEYRSERQAALESALDGTPLFVSGSPARRRDFDGLRLDLLFSFEPTPGTVVFFGYGSSMESPIERRWNDLDRTSDGLFVKLAYLFRR